MDTCMIPLEVIVEIAEYAPDIYGALAETCHEVRNTLTGMNPWKLFTTRRLDSYGGYVWVYNDTKPDGKLFIHGVRYTHGPNHDQISLYKRNEIKISINVLHYLGIVRHRVTFHYKDRNELVWGDSEYCNRLIAAYGVDDEIAIK